MISSFSLRPWLHSLIILLVVMLLAWPPAAHASDVESLRRFVDLARGNQWSSAMQMAKGKRGAVRDFMQWYYVRSSGSGANFEEITSFLKTNPDWPDVDMIITRGELAIMQSHPLSVRLKWFQHNPPKTAHGKMLYAVSLSEEKGSISAEAQTLLREAWRSGELESDDQKELYQRFGNALSKEDHIAAVDGLLWNERYQQAERLMELVPDEYRRLFNARMKMSQGGAGLDTAVRKVPPRLLNDPGFLYARLVWREKRGMKEGVRELLHQAPSNIPKPENWWKIRRLHIWSQIEDGRYKEAYRLLRNHGQKDGQSLAEAEWLAGWLQYAYLGNPGEAYKHFYRLHSSVEFPVSLSRGAYWAARAAKKHGSPDIAQRWLQVAGQYPSTFYGQMALAALDPNGGNRLPPPNRISDQDYERFKQRPVAQATLLLMRAKNEALTRRFLDYLIDSGRTPAERSIAAQLSKEMPLKMQVKAAKQAIQDGIILPELGYPVPRMPKNLAVEPALALAISRQESEFQTDVVSPAGAVGLMQLLPSTAKETAGKMGIGFNKNHLYDPDYNMLVGSAFLDRMVDNYGGSYILAIAAYNAGPGRVSRWLKEFGDPRKGQIEPALWIERIPITETRNYVHRVMENLIMYRHKLGGYKPGPITLPQDLER